MAVHIRLARHGSKKSPFYRIVVADQRAKRDGKFIENIGTVDPRTNPATVKLDAERLAYWQGKGAQLTHTMSRIVKQTNKTAGQDAAPAAG